VRLWASVLVEGSGGYAMWRNWPRDEFLQKRLEEQARGNQLIDVETYLDHNGIRRTRETLPQRT